MIVRTAAEWAAYPKQNPFPAAAKDEPNRLMLLLSKQPPAKDAAEIIQARAVAWRTGAPRRRRDMDPLPCRPGRQQADPEPPSTRRSARRPRAETINTVLKLLEMVTDMTDAPLIPRKYWAIAFAIVALAAIILLWLGRTPICTCGTVKLWVGTVHGPDNSQHLADWYTPSHIIHGFLFYLLGWLCLRRNPPGDRLIAAVVIESAWEILENSPLIIDRYRDATIAMGYTGDSVINSVADICWMMLGFGLARRLPVWATVAIAIGFELLTLIVIRDNLFLNVLMLVVADRRDPGLAGRRLMRRALTGLAVAAPPPRRPRPRSFSPACSPMTSIRRCRRAGSRTAPTSSSAGAARAARPCAFLGRPQPYVFASVATGGGTHFAAAGLSWRLGGRRFLPGRASASPSTAGRAVAS